MSYSGLPEKSYIRKTTWDFGWDSRAYCQTIYNYGKKAGIRHPVTPRGITKDHLYDWQKQIAGMTNREGHLIKPRTINTYNEGIKGFLSWLADNGHFPSGYSDLVRYVKEPVTLPGSILSHEKMRKMLSCIPSTDLLGYRDRAMLELLYSSGVRSAELLSLDTFHLDFKNGTMIVTGKGNKQRVVPVGRTALRHLETYIKAIRPFLSKDPLENALFFDRQRRTAQIQGIFEMRTYPCRADGI